MECGEKQCKECLTVISLMTFFFTSFTALLFINVWVKACGGSEWVKDVKEVVGWKLLWEVPVSECSQLWRTQKLAGSF